MAPVSVPESRIVATPKPEPASVNQRYPVEESELLGGLTPNGWAPPMSCAGIGPGVMSCGSAPAGRANSVIVPSGVIMPILSAADSVNQTSPSDPSVMPVGWPFGVGMAKSVRVPSGATRPILPANGSVNHRLPAPSLTTCSGCVAPVKGVAISVTPPSVEITAILLVTFSVIQIWSPTSVMAKGELSAVGTSNTPVMVPLRFMRAPGSSRSRRTRCRRPGRR